MNRILSFLLLALLAAPAFAQGSAALWDDGKPEVSIGVYFDLAGTVSVHETVTDTLTAYIILKNNTLRSEGDCIAVEYRLELPEGLEPEVGMGLQMQGPQGQPVLVQITAVAEATITIDANHLLAGQNLNFELELVEVS